MPGAGNDGGDTGEASHRASGATVRAAIDGNAFKPLQACWSLAGWEACPTVQHADSVAAREGKEERENPAGTGCGTDLWAKVPEKWRKSPADTFVQSLVTCADPVKEEA